MVRALLFALAIVGGATIGAVGGAIVGTYATEYGGVLAGAAWIAIELGVLAAVAYAIARDIRR